MPPPTRISGGGRPGRVGLAIALLTLGFGVAAAEWGEDKNRLTFNGQLGFNIRADFTKLGGFPPGTDPGDAISGVDHLYDNGYNRVDSSGNANGQTWFWGYDDPSQIVGNNILFSSLSSTGDGKREGVTDDPQWGAEILYARELGWSSSYWWGLEAGLGWLRLDFSEQAQTTSAVTQVTDAYELGGITVPLAPYRGTYTGPGPLIGDAPQRIQEILDDKALTTGRYNLEADLYAVRLGLAFETPFTEKIMLNFGGGLVGAFISSEFGFGETVALEGSNRVLQRSAADTEDDLLYGAYARAGLTFYLGRRAYLGLGARYDYLSRFSQAVAGREVELDFKQAIHVTAGLGFSF